MMLDHFKLAFENLLHRRVRSWLTILGIVIGIAAVVALVSLGQGLQYTVNQQFQKIGADKIIIQPKGVIGAPGSESGNTKLTKKDLDIVQKSPGVDMAAGRLMRTGKIEFNKKTKFSMVIGHPTDGSGKIIEESGLMDVEYGRMLKQGDKNKAVIGSEFAKEAHFGKAITVNDKIKINGEDFTVIGILKTGNNPGYSMSAFITLDAARDLFDEPDEVSMIIAKATDQNDMDRTIANIEKDLRRHRGLKENKEDFTAQSAQSFIESFLTIFNVINVLLVGLASISLIVGAVGIANTMYTAVLERRREIGIMKSIGARNSDIMKVFIFESSLIGLVGGAIGIAIGMGIAKFAELLIAGFLGPGFFQVYFPWYLIVGALAFAFVIGTLSGILPARQAAQMNPVDALRE